MKNEALSRSNKKIIAATGISLSVLSGLIFSNQIMTSVSVATVNVEASSSLPTDSDVNYTVNYVDSQDPSKVLATRTGVAKGGTYVTIPKVLVAGYSSEEFGFYIKPVTSESLKNQTFTAKLSTMEDVLVNVTTKEPGSSINFTNPTIKVKTNDVNYRSYIDDRLTDSQL